MKKWLSLFLAVALLLTTAAAFAEDTDAENDGKGTVTLLDDIEAVPEDLDKALNSTEPFAPDDVDKAVIGADNRITVDNTMSWPFSAIALMEVHGECGCNWQGTGFLVGNTGLMLTAAHCLVCPNHSKWADTIYFYFGYKSSGNYLYRYTGRWDAYVGNIFAQKKYSIEKDFAVVKISSDVPAVCGSLGAFWADDDSTVSSYYVNVAGYRDGKLRYDSGFLNVMDADHVNFLMDEVGGNSGGPIFTTDGYAVGIIIAETMDKNDNPIYNVGYRLTYEVWKLADEYSRK